MHTILAQLDVSLFGKPIHIEGLREVFTIWHQANGFALLFNVGHRVKDDPHINGEGHHPKPEARSTENQSAILCVSPGHAGQTDDEGQVGEKGKHVGCQPDKEICRV